MVEGMENVDAHEFVNYILNNQNDTGTRIDPESHKESPEVKITDDVQPVNVTKEEDESAEDDYELRRKTCHSKQYKSFFEELKGRYHYLFGHLKSTFMPRKSFHVLANHLEAVMQESLPSMLDSRVTEVTKTIVPVYVANRLIMERQKMQAEINNVISNHIPSRVDSSIRSYMLNHVLHVHPTQASKASAQEQQYQLYLTMKYDLKANKSEPGPSTSGNQEQLDDFDFWTDKYATDDDELPTENVSQELMEEMSETESRKEILSLPFPQKSIPVVQSCQRDPKAPTLSLFPVVIFPDEDIEERTSRWTKRAGKPTKEVYSNSKIIQVINTTGELGYEHKFVTKIITRRANGSIVSITEPDNKNLNKNDIEDMHLLCINGKVDDYAKNGLLWSLSVFIRSTTIWERVHDFHLGVESYQQKVNLTAPTITFPGIEKKRCSPSFLNQYMVSYTRTSRNKRK
ncbi:hypothetical protein Tco_1037628 [Tanacetum coccineum]